jgi:hypothetical protein
MPGPGFKDSSTQAKAQNARVTNKGLALAEKTINKVFVASLSRKFWQRLGRDVDKLYDLVWRHLLATGPENGRLNREQTAILAKLVDKLAPDLKINPKAKTQKSVIINIPSSLNRQVDTHVSAWNTQAQEAEEVQDDQEDSEIPESGQDDYTIGGAL